MAEYRIVREYPHPVDRVWQVMTEPDLVRRWTTTGQGGKPEGFAPEVGNEFRFVGKPTIGWRGIVDCTVLEVDPPGWLRYSWSGDENGEITFVTYRLEPVTQGTRFTWEHTGFTGLQGMLMSKLLARVRGKMLSVGVPRVLDELHPSGR